MDTLTRLGLHAYLDLTAAAPPPSHVLRERLEALRALTTPNDRAAIYESFPSFLHYYEEEDGWLYRFEEGDLPEPQWLQHEDEAAIRSDEHDDEASIFITPEQGDASRSAGSRVNARGGTPAQPPQPTSPDDVLLSLIVDKAALKSKYAWTFHLTDAGPYPSVPHGHSGRSLKLNAYTGHTYQERGTSTERESRQVTARLWNSEKFRQHAAKSISFTLEHDPTWRSRVRTERGTLHSERLPMRQRPRRKA